MSAPALASSRRGIGTRQDLGGRVHVGGPLESLARRTRELGAALPGPAVERRRFDRIAGQPPRGRLVWNDRDEMQVRPRRPCELDGRLDRVLRAGPVVEADDDAPDPGATGWSSGTTSTAACVECSTWSA